MGPGSRATRLVLADAPFDAFLTAHPLMPDTGCLRSMKAERGSGFLGLLVGEFFHQVLQLRIKVRSGTSCPVLRVPHAAMRSPSVNSPGLLSSMCSRIWTWPATSDIVISEIYFSGGSSIDAAGVHVGCRYVKIMAICGSEVKAEDPMTP
jgi:hypothetical protein